MPKEKTTIEQAKVVPGAHLMDFAGAAFYSDGIMYVPNKPRAHPGGMNEPFCYKFGEDGAPIDKMLLLLGFFSSMVQREAFNIRSGCAPFKVLK